MLFDFQKVYLVVRRTGRKLPGKDLEIIDIFRLRSDAERCLKNVVILQGSDSVWIVEKILK